VSKIAPGLRKIVSKTTWPTNSTVNGYVQFRASSDWAVTPEASSFALSFALPANRMTRVRWSALKLYLLTKQKPAR